MYYLHLVKLILDEHKTLTKVSTCTTSHNHSPKQAQASDTKEQENQQTTQKASCIARGENQFPVVCSYMHVLKVHSDDLDDGYNVLSENETLIQTILLLLYKNGMITIKQETFWSYKPSGRSLLLLEPVGRVSGLDITLSGLMLDVEGSFCFFAGDGPCSGFALCLLAAVSLCLFGM